MRQLTIERTASIIVFLLLFALAARIPTDTDTWWHIRSGEHTLTQGMIYTDPFSFTRAGEPWVNHSWLSQVVLYGAWRLAGNLGLSVLMAGLATAGMFVIYRMCAGNAYLRAFALVLGAATAAVFWSPRPQMFSFLLSAVILYLIYLYKYKQIDRLWLVPVIMGLWGNLHAGYSIGFIFLGGALAGEVLGRIFDPDGEFVLPWRKIGKLALVTVIAVPALLVNPYGLDILLLPFRTVSIGALRDFIQEWNSPNFHERQTWPFIALLLGVLGAAGMSQRRLDWTEFVLVGGTTFMALLAGRNIAVFAVVATPVLTYHLDAILQERGWGLNPRRFVTANMARLNVVLIVVVLIGSLAKVLIVLDAETVAEAQAQFLPVAAAQHLAEVQPTGPMFNSYNWGGYLMFAVPEYPVFVDGRTDMYGNEFLLDYLRAAVGGDNWRDIFADYDINVVVVESGSGLAQNLREESDWLVEYDDETAVIFTRAEVTYGDS